MKTWTRVPEEDEGLSKGLVVGCEDGSLYIFDQQCPSILVDTVDLPPPGVVQSPRSKSTMQNPFQYSRSTSPSAAPMPFLVSPRPRVVSGVSKELVEAPKNYVDFDDEPDKLKDMLKGKNPSNKAVSDTASERTASVKSPSSPLTPIIPSAPTKRKELSTPPNSSRPFSAPVSPRDRTSLDFDLVIPEDLELRYHIIPRTNGAGNAVESVSVLVDSLICVVLQESGILYLFSLTDGHCLTSVQAKDGLSREQLSPKDRDVLYETYAWHNLQVTTTQQGTYLIASASNRGGTPSAASDIEDIPQERTLSVIYGLVLGREARPMQHSLEFLGTWELDCIANSLNILTNPDGRDLTFCIDTDGTLCARNLKVLPTLPAPPSLPESESTSAHINIPNPFKLKSKSSEHLPIQGTKINFKVLLDEPQELGRLLLDTPLCGFTIRPGANNLFGLVWTEKELIVVECSGEFDVLYRNPVEDVMDVQWLDDNHYAVLYEDRVEVYDMQHVDANNDSVQGQHITGARYYPNLHISIPIDHWDAAYFPSPSELLIVSSDPCGREICVYSWDEDSSVPVPQRLFRAPAPVSPDAAATALFPLGVGLMLQGNSDGYLRLLSLEQLCQTSDAPPDPIKVSDRPLNGYITGFHLVTNFRTKDKYIVGGADDGSIAFWAMHNLELCGRWVLFNTALSKVVQFPEEKGSPLYGCVLCIAEDGAIAVIALDEFQFLYLIPGASVKLETICLGGHNLLLMYGDRRCRLWDVQTKEFWRSMGVEKAHEMLDQGGWTRIDLDSGSCASSTVWNVPAPLPKSPDAASMMSLQAERFITSTIAIAKTISTSRDQTRVILQSLDHLRTILSALLTPGFNDDMDSVCKEKLRVGDSGVSVGLAIADSITLYNIKENGEVWCISGNVTAARLLSIVLVLKAVALFEEYAEAASSVISYYTTSLPTYVGAGYKPPSLPYLANLWFQGSMELRQAIRVVFDATISAMSDEEAISIVEHWQIHIPCLQIPSERESTTAALSLFICGYIAAEKYSFMSAPVLREISKSISLYLLDETSTYRVLAIDLCSRGFNVWQYYIDAMEILRSLFMLATTSRKNDISPQNVGAQARAAVLFIATTNTPLFMSTLGLDILTPPTLEHRRSVLQIVAFLIRKRPSVLQPNLPRLMEAVVKSLDPNNTTNRDAVLDTATEIIGYVVKTFPTVDFHMSSQRLAAGTNEGAVVMYDLKTAIRLFVLEGHKKPITAVSFSPDGRRLVTLSMEESVALVWKVGASFISFFTPGAPPRQGNSGGHPFKTFNFNIGSEANMSATEVLTQVKSEWASDRSVKLKIRNSTLTFST
ncbi:WD40 repeat-like protein [Macrolepiota fuliginosa MF-IS2]|uniref:WD40 repeat-like protein n=1 Tax=Macrolepiota fuliginosa MF-IS2 TaxID=1400762 RepID=A0A9P6C5P3_9AGAR|nr:WD40 repeat-like protein [Macrolepiota fuliginosa MF-IS2]